MILDTRKQYPKLKSDGLMTYLNELYPALQDEIHRVMRYIMAKKQAQDAQKNKALGSSLL